MGNVGLIAQEVFNRTGNPNAGVKWTDANTKKDWWDKHGGDQGLWEAMDGAYMSLLGRHVSSDEVNAVVANAQQSGMDPGSYVSKFVAPQIKESEAYQTILETKADKKAADAQKKAYDAEAPLRGLAYSALYDALNSEYGSGESALKQNLAARGLADSGSLGAGLVSLNQSKMKAAGQGAMQIEQGSLSDALSAANAERDWQKKLTLTNMGYEQDQKLANQNYENQYNIAKLGQTDEQPWEKALSIGGALLGNYLLPGAGTFLGGMFGGSKKKATYPVYS